MYVAVNSDAQTFLIQSFNDPIVVLELSLLGSEIYRKYYESNK